MTSGFSINFDEVGRAYRLRQQNNKTYRAASMATNSLFNQSAAAKDSYISEKGNICTDGKDDGKIGLFQGIVSAVKGVVKGGFNMIKGAFCDENGFSLLKTLKTAGIAALCIAVPAVGMALAGVGIATGGVKVVKSIADAANAKTDAEKKDALENLGEGGLTVGISVLGAKASFNAIKAKASLIATKSGGSALKALEGTKPTIGQFGKALCKDMWSTTKNGFKNMWESTKSFFRYRKAKLDLAKSSKEYNKALKSNGKSFDGSKVEQQYSAFKDAKHNFDCRKNDFSDSYFGKLTNLKLTKKAIDMQMHPFKTTGLTRANFKAAIKFVQKYKGKGLVNEVAKKFGSKGTAILDALKNGKAECETLVKDYGYNNVNGVLELLGLESNLNQTI